MKNKNIKVLLHTIRSGSPAKYSVWQSCKIFGPAVLPNIRSCSPAKYSV